MSSIKSSDAYEQEVAFIDAHAIERLDGAVTVFFSCKCGGWRMAVGMHDAGARESAKNGWMRHVTDERMKR